MSKSSNHGDETFKFEAKSMEDESSFDPCNVHVAQMRGVHGQVQHNRCNENENENRFFCKAVRNVSKVASLKLAGLLKSMRFWLYYIPKIGMLAPMPDCSIFVTLLVSQTKSLY